MMRLYRALLHLYPAGYRAEYEGELCAVFGERMREISGPLAPARRALAAVADVVPNALAVHWDVLRQDLRHAARSLRRSPGFAATAVLVVALGVGANTAAFSLADYVLVRPLPFPAPDRLVKLWQATPGYGRNELSPAVFRDWRAMATSFAGMEAYTGQPANLVGTAEPRRLETVRVTPGLFELVGVPAFAGRVIVPADSAAGPVAVLSHALWQSQFGGAASVLGQVVRLDGVPHTVIGVMPPSFRFPHRDVEAWTPLVFGAGDYEDRTDTYLQAVARLRRGVTVERARGEMAVVTARLDRQYPPEGARAGAAVVRLRDEMGQRARLLVLALCGAALCILLLACANLASLLIARSTGRARELAVRAALGAGRERLVRQLLTESAVLALIGGVVGVLTAAAAVPLLAQLVPAALPVAEQPSVNLRALAVAAALVAVTGLAFGIAPAARAGRSSALAALREGERAGARTQRVRATLVVVEVAASVVLLIASGLLIRAVWSIQARDPGFRTAGVLRLRTALPLPKYDSVARREQFFTRVLREVRALPGVQAAAYVTGLPMEMRGGIWGAEIAGRPPVRDESNGVSLRYVTPGFFSALGVPLREGRDVADADTREQPYAAVVSESFARRHWPNERAVGKRFTVAFDERTVVGVVGDVRVRGREQESEPQVYLPYRQVADGAIRNYVPKELVVRADAPPAALLPAIRRIVRAADPEQPVSHVRTLADLVGEETAPRVTQLRLLALLSAVALLIAGVGIHGLLAFTVSQRSRELGVRRALGAPTGGIVGLVVREGAALALAGVAIGVLVAYPAARAMGALLAGVRPADPAAMGAAAALCLATALVGCLRPALRAARIDPATALRAE